VENQRLIVIVDGTWNRADPPPGVERTNAARIAQSIPRLGGDGVRQTVFYLEGIGTRGKADAHLKAYTGHGIRRLIRTCYLFLAHNWREGDQVFFVGVSRGSFVLRRLSEWIAERGLLAPGNLGELEADWLAFRDHGQTRQRAREITIRFFGAFDMVDALGVPLRGFRGWSAPKVGTRAPLLPAIVESARHALAADELRGAFDPTLWIVPPDDKRAVEQVWFAGAHGDVCGGFGNRALSDVSLEWMVGHARAAGLAIDEPQLAIDLSAEPTAQRKGLHLLLPVLDRRPLETSPHTESLHPSFLEKAKMEPYTRAPVVVSLRQKGVIP